MKRFLALALVVSLAVAADDVPRPDRPGLEIGSKEAVFQLKEKVWIYRGDVVVTDPPAKPGDPPTVLKCQVLTARMATNGGFETIVAETDVQISQGDQHARGEKAIYTQATEELVIYGGDKLAMLASPQGTNYGERIVYNRTNDTLKIVGAVKTQIPGASLQKGTNSSPGSNRSLFRF